MFASVAPTEWKKRNEDGFIFRAALICSDD